MIGKVITRKELEKLNPAELIRLYSEIIKQLKEKEVIRSNNLVGDLGEYLAIDYYSKTRGLPRLQAAPPSTKNIDAISTDGDRYSIKCITGKTTGVFYGIPKPGEIPDDQIKQSFEYLIVVILNSDFELDKILELDWKTFLKHRRWHSRMNACNVTVAKKVEAECKTIFAS